MKYLVCNLKNKMGLTDFLKYNTNLKDIEPLGTKLIIAPSSAYFLMMNPINYSLASQDITSLIDETVTGELTGRQLASYNIKYCIVGHSERRIFKKEINIDFINKITEAVNHGLSVIYCIGETLQEKNNNQTKEVLDRQISEVLNNVELKDIIIAYEPVWAIGSGKVPTNKEIEENINYIKKIIREKYDLNMPVLYGGSVNPDNITTLVDLKNADGFLVGGASLDVSSIKEILKVMNETRKD